MPQVLGLMTSLEMLGVSSKFGEILNSFHLRHRVDLQVLSKFLPASISFVPPDLLNSGWPRDTPLADGLTGGWVIPLTVMKGPEVGSRCYEPLSFNSLRERELLVQLSQVCSRFAELI
jgi:hypothetical protein